MRSGPVLCRFFLYCLPCHGSRYWGEEQEGRFFKERHGDLVMCLPLTSITDAWAEMPGTFSHVSL